MCIGFALLLFRSVLFFIYIGQKRKHFDEGGLVELAQIFQQAEERAAERDNRTRSSR